MKNDLVKRLQRNKDWVAVTYIYNDEKAPERFSEIAVILARGHPYIELKIIPKEYAFQEEIVQGRTPRDGHLVYGKLSNEAKREKILDGKYKGIIEVREEDFGEVLHIRR